MAADFSVQLGWLTEKDAARIRTLFTQLGLPVSPPQVDPGDFLAAMALDKKVQSGQIRLVLLKSIGNAVITADYPSHKLVDMLASQFVT